MPKLYVIAMDFASQRYVAVSSVHPDDENSYDNNHFLIPIPSKSVGDMNIIRNVLVTGGAEVEMIGEFS